MSASNRTSLLYVPESTFGVTPGSPTMSFVRMTSESMKQDTQYITSQELRSDRMTADSVRVDASASGGFAFELSSPSGATPDTPANTLDTFFKAGLFSAGWSSAVTVAGSIDASSVDNSFNSTALFGSLNVGQWIRTTLFTNPGNNGYFKILDKPSSNKIIVAGLSALTTEASAARNILQMPQVVNGTTMTTFTFERRYEDTANEFVYYRGMAVSTLAMSIQRGAIATGEFGFIGTRESSGAVTLAAATTAASSTEVMNGVDDLVFAAEKMTAGANDFDMIGMSLNLQNNLRALTELGTLGATQLGAGSLGVTGSITAYFKNKTVFDRYLNAESTDVAMVLQKKNTTQAWIIDLPRIKFTSGVRVAGGLNQDITAELQFTSLRNSTEDIMMRIARAT